MITKIKEDRIAAMKSGDTLKKDLLSILIGSACKDVKEPSDDDVTATIKSFIKRARQLQVDVANNNGNQSYINKAEMEIAILEAYLPRQLSDQELKDVIQSARNHGCKDMKCYMGYLKENYADRYDGKIASFLIKQAMS